MRELNGSKPPGPSFTEGPLSSAALQQINPPRPADPREFQRELDRLGKEHNIELRVVWGPEQDQWILDGQCFKKYRLITGFVPRKKGDIVTRGGQRVGYISLSGIVSGQAPTPGCVILPDIEYVQPAMDRWIIEQRLRDDVVKRQHAAARYAIVEQVLEYRCINCDHEFKPDGPKRCPRCGEGRPGWLEPIKVGGRQIDALGPFPREGWWVCFLIVGVHDDDAACCNHFADLGQICIGSGPRMPDYRDLDIVLQSLAERDSRAIYRDLDEFPSELVDQSAESLTEKLIDRDGAHWDEIKKEVGEDIALLLNKQVAPTFDIGASTQKLTQKETP
jgi:hypothetical protein